LGVSETVDAGARTLFFPSPSTVVTPWGRAGITWNIWVEVTIVAGNEASRAATLAGELGNATGV